jgi:hypothetical protein
LLLTARGDGLLLLGLFLFIKNFFHFTKIILSFQNLAKLTYHRVTIFF